VLRRRGSTKGFYGFTARFTPSRKEIEKATQAWRESKTSNYSQGATHFEGDRFNTPSWAKSMVKTAHIDHQIFYKEA
jgi:citrate lyase beta subunit